MANFEIKIKMTAQDVATLKEQGYSLYAFKAVRASGKGSPTVWFNYEPQKLLTVTNINWVEKYQGYNSTSQIIENGTIQSSNDVSADLGDKVSIDSNGNLSVTSDAAPASISFLNEAHQQFTIGISQEVSGKFEKLCAFPILGSGAGRIIEPITKVLLMFSTKVINTGTVITQAFSPGAFIDLTGVDSREVNYNVNDGWSANGATWLKNIPAFTDISSYLIEKSAVAVE
ncbi:MAG: hypothetical protein N4A59_00570 [Marinifilum sp.]|jgi:hypothetical protein|nr:hypothetical protein [Marinifilum sp.]